MALDSLLKSLSTMFTALEKGQRYGHGEMQHMQGLYKPGGLVRHAPMSPTSLYPSPPRSLKPL